MDVKVSPDETINFAIYNPNSDNFNQSLSARPMRKTVKPVRYRQSIDSPTVLSQRSLPESMLQPITKHLRLTLVSMWNSALPEKFNFCFQGVFC